MIITSIGDYCLSQNPREKPIKVGQIIYAEYKTPLSTHEITLGILFDDTIKFIEETAYGILWEWDLNNLTDKEQSLLKEIMVLYKKGS